MGDESTLAEDLAAAWDEAEAETTEAPVDEQIEVQQPDPDDSAGDLDEAVASGSEERPDGAPDLEVVPAGEADPVPQDAGADDKPPVGLAPAAREAWKDLPKVVKDEIRKREEDYEKGIMKYAEQAKRAEMMDRTLQPFQQLFAMNGGAGQFMPNLLQTAALLQMGSPQQKAQMAAQLINQFGVDIGTLDTILSGQQPQQQQQPQLSVEQLVDQRLQQFQQHQQQQQATEQQQVIAGEVQAFAQDPKNEFYQDVKNDMADLMDMAARRGQDMTMKQAYERAIQMNPQISQIIAARQAQQTTAVKRQAASSISGSPGGPGTPGEPGSVRSALEEAWENAGRV